MRRCVFDGLVGLIAIIGLQPMAWAEPSSVEARDDVLALSDVGATLRVETRVDDGKWRRKRAVDLRADQSLTLRVRPKGEVEDLQVRWYLVFADITREYQNANKPWEEDPGEWTGFDEVHYYRVELDGLRDQLEVNPLEAAEDIWAPARSYLRERGSSREAVAWYVHGLGTYWFQVEVERDGQVKRSAGVHDVTKKGLSTDVLRVSVRQDDSYLGHLTAFYNVPSVFGSVMHQSKHHLAADCADVLVAAHSEWTDEPMAKNYNVAMVAKMFDERVETDMEDGAPSEPLTWSVDIEPGDLIAVQYDEAWSTRYNHIGALAGDNDGDGVLSPKDLVIHAGPEPLHAEALSTGAFDGHIIIVRP